MIEGIKQYFVDNAYDVCIEKFEVCAPPPHGQMNFDDPDCEICGGYVDLYFTHFDFEAHFGACEEEVMACAEEACKDCEDEWSMDGAVMDDPFADCFHETETNDFRPMCRDCEICHDDTFETVCATLEQDIVHQVVMHLETTDPEMCGPNTTVVAECAPPPHGNQNFEAPIC